MTDLPYLADTDSSVCLDNGLTCSVDPRTSRCTECGGTELNPTPEFTGTERDAAYDFENETWR